MTHQKALKTGIIAAILLVTASQNADVVILYVDGHSARTGRDRTEGEGQDTANIKLPSHQVESDQRCDGRRQTDRCYCIDETSSGSRSLSSTASRPFSLLSTADRPGSCDL